MRMLATSSSTSSFSMKCCLVRPLSSCCFLFDSSSVMRLICQPVSSEARRTFWPLRPMATARFSSSTTTSIACFSSSTTMDETSAGASAPMTNWAGSADHSTISTRSPASSCVTACTREPRMPTQVPIGSMRLSLVCTAILALLPGAHAVADAQVFLRDHVLARQQRLQAARLDDGAAALHALHRPGDELVAAGEEIVKDLLALRVADALQDHLLRRLCANAPELDVRDRLLDDIVHLGVGLAAVLGFLDREHLRGVPLRRIVRQHAPAAEGLVIAGVLVDLHADVDVLGVFFLGRRGERHFERAEDDVARDVLLPGQDIDQHHQFPITRYYWI